MVSRVKDLPYVEEPMRGGIRIHLDNTYATRIKRNELVESGEAFKAASEDGQETWSFFGFLKAQGIDTDKVEEAWIIHDERRVQRLSRGELVTATFMANPQNKGEILFGYDKTPTHAIALHTKPLQPEDLPVIMPNERFDF